jgi:nitroreductase
MDMELLAAIQERRATREFEAGEVSRDDLARLIHAALWAPSAMNNQSWHFTVVTDKALLQRISTQAKTWMLTNVPAELANEHFDKMLRDPNVHIFHHAPALIVISAPDGDRWTTENCALAAQNLMLAATELALGTCWIGLAQGWLNTAEGHHALNLPSSQRVVAPIIVGYPKKLSAACHVQRKPADIAWIGPGLEPMVEVGTSAPDSRPGVYGSLIHP